jgi:hypothetical protein
MPSNTFLEGFSSSSCGCQCRLAAHPFLQRPVVFVRDCLGPRGLGGTAEGRLHWVCHCRFDSALRPFLAVAVVTTVRASFRRTPAGWHGRRAVARGVPLASRQCSSAVPCGCHRDHGACEFSPHSAKSVAEFTLHVPTCVGRRSSFAKSGSTPWPQTALGRRLDALGRAGLPSILGQRLHTAIRCAADENVPVSNNCPNCSGTVETTVLHSSGTLSSAARLSRQREAREHRRG